MSIICNSIFMITLSFIVIREYTVLQGYHYEFNKYLLNIKSNHRKYYYFLYCLLGIFLIKFDFLYLLLNSFLLVYLIKKYNLKYTSRVKRVFIINFIFILVMIITNTLKYVFIVPFLYLVLLHYFSLLVEKIILKRYIKKAKEKVKNKFVIGVTGSCGKTSVKNIIYDLMIGKFNVVKTPKSYNNSVGICKSINDNVNYNSDYFICEYGVDRVKGMDKLIKIVTPHIAIITEIGNQHLLTFKSRENILHEKMKLIECLDSDGIGVINNDNDLLSNYDYKNKNILRYGINNYSDVMARNISLFEAYSEFDLYIKDRYISRVKINLLSKHAIENVLCGITVCLALDLSIEEILKNIRNILPIEHRLELKYIDNVLVIDDAFNSNIKGFKDAIEVLNRWNKYRIVITPGIIEQGNNNEFLNREIAKELMDLDYVFLVSENSKSIKNELDINGFDKYMWKKDFKEAFDEVKKINKDKIVLIENDLPDIYLK